MLLILSNSTVGWWRIHTGTRTVVVASRITTERATAWPRDKEVSIWHTTAASAWPWRWIRIYPGGRGHPS